MNRAKQGTSGFSPELRRSTFNAYFLGAVVPLVALGIVIARYALAVPLHASSIIGLIGMLASICVLSLTAFLMLRRLVGQAMENRDRDKRQLASLLDASADFVAAQQLSDVAATATRHALELTGARAAFLLSSDGGAPPKLAGTAGDEADAIFGALAEPLVELADQVIAQERPAIHRKEADSGSPLASALAVPLVGEVAFVGALVVIHTDPQRRFDDDQFDGLATLAKLASVALSRARTLEENRLLANFDTLTQLPNRRLYWDRLEQALIHAKRRGTLLAAVFIDLDGFKRINDTFGHSGGDRLLCAVAKRLLWCLRAGDSVARVTSDEADNGISRLGGDEFTFMLRELPDPQTAATVAWRVLEALRNPFMLEGQEVVVTASLGLALFPQDGEDVETLLRNADAAMYWAKNRGRNNYQFYQKSLNASAARKIDLESRLRRALRDEQLSLNFQPIHDALSDEIIGAEALLRWNDTELGPISPLEFVPLAEQLGLIVEIGDWVLRTACAQCQAWQDAGHDGIRVAVNLSGHQLRHPALVARIAEALAEAQLNPDDLELEITESTIMQDDDVTRTAFRDIHEMGIGLALDDFGTGYSSLSYLKRFPIGRVKIDRSFIKDVITSHDDASIVDAIIAMAHSLGLKTVAEGVESHDQVMFLRERHCDELQGYFYSQPLPPEEFLRILEQSAVEPSPGSGFPLEPRLKT